MDKVGGVQVVQSAEQVVGDDEDLLFSQLSVVSINHGLEIQLIILKYEVDTLYRIMICQI
jgi:hypothetical protein